MTTLLRDLSENDLRGALFALRALAEEGGDCDAFVARALDTLPALVPSDLTTLSLCDLRRGTRTVFARKGEAISDAARESFDRHFRNHPLVRFHGSHPRGPTQRISDCPVGEAFRNSALYADYYNNIGIRYVMALPLRIDESNVVSIVFNRSASDFQDNERALLEGVRPVLAALYRERLKRTRDRGALSAGHLEALPLTRTEREVLALLAAGKTNAEIGALLGNSARTVQKHVEHIFQKLGVETRTAAVVRALTAAGSP
jgi:DNA-binding CsgD family transcriptional regulator